MQAQHAATMAARGLSDPATPACCCSCCGCCYFCCGPTCRLFVLPAASCFRSRCPAQNLGQARAHLASSSSGLAGYCPPNSHQSRAAAPPPPAATPARTSRTHPVAVCVPAAAPLSAAPLLTVHSRRRLARAAARARHTQHSTEHSAQGCAARLASAGCMPSQLLLCSALLSVGGVAMCMWLHAVRTGHATVLMLLPRRSMRAPSNVLHQPGDSCSAAAGDDKLRRSTS